MKANAGYRPVRRGLKKILLARAIQHALALAGAAAIATEVQAQEPESHALEEITVTARKVSENLQDTPIAITAFTGDALADRQVFATNLLDQVVPNLQFADNAAL